MFTIQTQSNNYPYLCLRESEKILRSENTVEMGGSEKHPEMSWVEPTALPKNSLPVHNLGVLF